MLHRILNTAGVKCSIKKVQRHMVKNGLRSVVVKKYEHHSSGNGILKKENTLITILMHDFKYKKAIDKQTLIYYNNSCSSQTKTSY